MAALLAEDERLDVIEARALSGEADSHENLADVVVAAGLLRSQIPRTSGVPVVVISDIASQARILQRQVYAWLPANATGGQLAAAIVAAANDLIALTEEQTRRWLRIDAEDDQVVQEALTARELEVLRMLADGLGNKEIAARLEISTHTVKFHVAQILAKLGTGSRAEAVAVGMRRGLVPI